MYRVSDDMDSCGPGGVFKSFLTGQTGLNYTSSLRAEDVPLSVSGTITECVDGIDLQIIGSATICITGKGYLYIGNLSCVIMVVSNVILKACGILGN